MGFRVGCRDGFGLEGGVTGCGVGDTGVGPPQQSEVQQTFPKPLTKVLHLVSHDEEKLAED